MPEHNIKTVPIYFKNEKIGTAESDFIVNLEDITGRIHDRAWSFNSLEIDNSYQKVVEILGYKFFVVLDFEAKQVIALSLDNPVNMFPQYEVIWNELDPSLIKWYDKIKMLVDVIELIATEIVTMQRNYGSECTNDFLFRYNELMRKE